MEEEEWIGGRVDWGQVFMVNRMMNNEIIDLWKKNSNTKEPSLVKKGEQIVSLQPS